jgi:dolichyl-phosphate-mannose-protein mannosyltransferase
MSTSRVSLWMAILVRTALLLLPGHPVDVGTFQAWALRLAEVGPTRFYASVGFVDYTPGYLLVLWPIGRLIRLFPMAGPALAKLPPLLADFAVAALLARLGGARAARWYLWNPAVLVAGALWGQAESVAMAWLLGGWWMLVQGRILEAAALFGFAGLTKPQYAPGLLLAAVWAARAGFLRRDNAVRALGVCGAAVVLPSLLFGLTPLTLVGLILRAANVYPYGSVNALNLWYLLGLNWKSDATPVLGIPAALWGQSLVGFVGLVVLWRCWRAREVGTVWLGTAALFCSVFALATRMHERYLFPALPFLLLAWSRGRTGRAVGVGVSLALLGNLLYGLAYLSTFPAYRTWVWEAVWTSFRPPLPQLLAVLVLVSAGWTLWEMECRARLRP